MDGKLNCVALLTFSLEGDNDFNENLLGHRLFFFPFSFLQMIKDNFTYSEFVYILFSNLLFFTTLSLSVSLSHSTSLFTIGLFFFTFEKNISFFYSFYVIVKSFCLNCAMEHCQMEQSSREIGWERKVLILGMEDATGIWPTRI